jgi:UDP-2,3-diacylglucosamine pyrophosphatase LpxH
MADKTIYVISDLHMGDGGPRDNFACEENREQELDSFLKFVKRENGELIILGDLFDFWQASLANILVRSKVWIEKFADMKATYVVGNHDIDIAGFIKDREIDSDFLPHRFFKGMRRKFRKNIANKKFMFMHGHEIDAVNKGDNPGVGRILAIAVGLVEDLVGTPRIGENLFVEEILNEGGEAALEVLRTKVKELKQNVTECFGAQLTPVQNADRKKELLSKYKKNKDEQNYDVAIVGHTHQAGQFEDWYFNSGSWAGKNNEFLTISPEGKIDFHHWRNSTDVLIDTPVIKS